MPCSSTRRPSILAVTSARRPHGSSTWESRADRSAAPDMNRHNVQFETQRLIVRVATSDDASSIASLWSDPRVVSHVGFPRGIPTAAQDVPRRIERSQGLDALLIAELRASREPIGQCMLGTLNSLGISEPDIKLHPSFWGRGYGRELWAALIDQLFRHSPCAVVRGTPNIENTASVRMQESAGMRRLGGGTFELPDSMKPLTEPVSYAL
jgi:RimJ/RimL family protein N-acetyltransferase